eukprot:scaffold95483_cov63-Phaeocystis_antarctica.AAC.1
MDVCYTLFIKKINIGQIAETGEATAGQNVRGFTRTSFTGHTPQRHTASCTLDEDERGIWVRTKSARRARVQCTRWRVARLLRSSGGEVAARDEAREQRAAAEARAGVVAGAATAAATGAA